MGEKILIFIGSIIFFVAAIKTFFTQEIIGKAGYIYLGEYAYVVSFVLLIISFMLFYIASKKT